MEKEVVKIDEKPDALIIWKDIIEENEVELKIYYRIDKIEGITMYVCKINNKQTCVLTNEHNNKWTLINTIPKQNISNDFIEALGKLINSLENLKELRVE